MTENQRRRKEALENYYLNPNICLQCGKIIRIKENQQVAEVKKKKFCDRSCASKYNNKKFPKRISKNVGLCVKCGQTIIFKKLKKGGYNPKKYCALCLKAKKVEVGNSIAWHNFPPLPIEEQSKAEVKRRNHNTRLWWGNRISKHSRKVYKASGKPYVCKQCGYSVHVDICHIRDIQDFPDTALVKEINDPDNLIALCKNHHWEFDHGLLKLSREDE